MEIFYDILLDKSKIGTTQFEKADAPMGVVFGKIDFDNTTSGYDFFKKYCLGHSIAFDDYHENRLISTRNIPGLQAFNSAGIEIKGLACSVDGMDSDGFEISIELIPYPFYEEEFPNHVKTYNEMFKK